MHLGVGLAEVALDDLPSPTVLAPAVELAFELLALLVFALALVSQPAGVLVPVAELGSETVSLTPSVCKRDRAGFASEPLPLGLLDSGR